MLRKEFKQGPRMDSQMQLGGAAVTPQKPEITVFRFLIGFNMQSSVKRTHPRTEAKTQAKRAGHIAHNLNELRQGEEGVIERLDLPEDDARRLMELGFLPGHTVTPAHSAPGGDPRVFRVDGSEVALRRETARKLILRTSAETA
jgi:ferrous iron transport protein A